MSDEKRGCETMQSAPRPHTFLKSNNNRRLTADHLHLCLLTLAALLLIQPVFGMPRLASAQTTVSDNQAKEQKKKDERLERSVRLARERGQNILQVVKNDLIDYYYDPNFHGMDIEARFKLAEEKIKVALGEGQVNSIIAQVLVELNDSHTLFFPTGTLVRVDYGWRMQVIGDKCYVIAVKPGSDAAEKGIKVGDLVYSLDGYNPNRENFWKMRYSYFVLKPRTNTSLVVEQRDGTMLTVELKARFTLNGKELSPDGLKKEEPKSKEVDKKDKDKNRETVSERLPSYHELSKDLVVCRMPGFIISEKDADRMMKKIAPYQALILDLRGNRGGYSKTLERFAGYFFDQDTKIADRKGRHVSKPQIAKARKENAFKGRLVVLVDGDSASAAEIFARLVQITKRGKVVGDRSSGKVMQSRQYFHLYKFPGGYVSYGTSVTNADVIMSDGKSLEHVGVMPDELLLPTRSDLAARRDPVMSRAAALLDFQISPRQAGALFPREDSTEFETGDPENPVDDDGGEKKN